MSSSPSWTTAQAGSRRFCLVGALRPHTKAPYTADLLWRTPRALKRPGRGRTVGECVGEIGPQRAHASRLVAGRTVAAAPRAGERERRDETEADRRGPAAADEAQRRRCPQRPLLPDRAARSGQSGRPNGAERAQGRALLART